MSRNSNRDITVGVKVDRKRAQADVLAQLNKIGDEVGNAFGAIGSGLKFPALLAGIGELPAATLAITNVAGALQQLAGAGLVIPGVIGGIAASFGTVKLGVAGVSDAFEALQTATDGSADSIEKANEALKKLAPNAQEAVKAASDVTTELREALQQPIQQNLFAGVSDDLRKLVDADLPILQKGLGGISTALNQNLRQVLSSFGSERSQGLLDRILGNTADAQARFTNAIDPIVNAIGTLTAAGTDVLPRLADGLTGVGRRFEKFVTDADNDGRLDKWINEGIDGFSHLGETVLSIGKILGSLTEAAGGDGGLLKLLDEGTEKLATFLNSAEGQNQLQEWFAEGRRQLGDLIDFAREAGPALGGVFEAGKDAANTLVPLIRDVLDVINDIPGGAQTVVTAFLAWKGITAAGDLAAALGNVSTLLGVGLPNAAKAGATTMTAALGPVAAMVAAITIGIPTALAALNRGGSVARQPGESLDAYLKRAQDAGVPTPGLAPVAVSPNTADLGGLLGAPAAPPAPNPRAVQGPFPVGSGGSPLSPGGALSGGAKPPINPTDLGGLLGGYAAGGPITGSGPRGRDSVPIMAAPGEHMLTADDVDRMGGQSGVYAFRRALRGYAGGGEIGTGAIVWPEEKARGRIDKTRPGGRPDHSPGSGGTIGLPDWSTPGQKFGPPPSDWWLKPINPDDVLFPDAVPPGQRDRQREIWERLRPRIKPLGYAGGGEIIDPFGNPVTPGAAPGPADPIAPNPAAGGIGGIASAFFSGLGGPLGQISGLLQGGAGGPGGGIPGVGGAATGSGFNLTPGFAGLAQAGGNPDMLNAWGQQTGDWLGNFAAKTLTSFGSTLWQGALGLFGLENSILSPSNTYTSAALKGAGFFLGNDGPLAQGGQGGTGATKPATDKQLREGQQTIDRADQRIAEITQRIAELPGDAKQSQRLALDNDLTNARQDAADARTDMSGLSSRGGTGAGGIPQAHGPGNEQGLQVNTLRVKRAVNAMFPQITDIGGVRPDKLKWHPNGLAVDVMIPGGDTHDGANPQGKALGDQIYSYLEGNKAAFGIDYILWQTDKGGNHFTHLHVNTTGGGYPQAYARGGGVGGSGSGDTVPAMLTPGEHVLTTADVAALGGQAGVYSLREALHFARGGGVPTGAVIQPLPPLPKPNFLTPDVKPITRTPAPAVALPRPLAPATVAPPPEAAAPPAPAPTAPPQPAPVGGPAPTGAAPSSYDHNLPAVTKGIASAASTLGSIAQTAAAVGTFGAAGAAGGLGGGLGGGGGGPSIQGLFQLGGKAVTGLVNVGSSFLVGNVTPGTTDNAYGETLNPAQRQPATAPLNGRGGATYNIEAGYRPTDIMDAIGLKEAQDAQGTLARFRG